MIRWLAALVLCAVWPVAAFADPSSEVLGEIDYLIALIRTSPCVFIRNGEDYDGPAAADHIREKFDYFRDRIDTAEDFIARAASKSELSGRPYQVRCPGQETLAAADWLQAELRAHRAKTSD